MGQGLALVLTLALSYSAPHSNSKAKTILIMKMYSKIVLLAFVFLPVAGGLFAQQTLERTVVANRGGTATNGSKSLEFTVGQNGVRTVNAGNYTLTEGFEQGTLVIVGIDEDIENPLETVSVYPIPTRSQLMIDLGEIPLEKVQIKFMDLQGKDLQLSLSPGNSEFVQSCDFGSLSAGIYFVEVFRPETGQRKIFKVQKVD